MAFAEASATAPDRPGAPLSLNLSSNNPFRNRTTDPSPRNSPFAATFAPPLPPPPRPTSTNPFLDPKFAGKSSSSAPSHANDVMTGRANNNSSSSNNDNNNTQLPADLFNELSLLEKPVTNVAPQAVNGGPTPQTHRPLGMEDRRAPPRPPRAPASPSKRDVRPPPPRPQRRASESSIMEKDRRPRIERDREDRPERTESEERRRRDRRREREERHRREKEKTRGGEKRTRKPQGLDIIDKLDVTGIYGQGLFHHDGPFDACNPHRNAKKDRRAPMQAFPVGSANMALGGSGPLRSRVDLDKFHGRGEEGFADYATTKKRAELPTIVDPLQRVEPVHGEESYGLGTSTFLEGAPASKSALQRRDSEDPALDGGAGGGLSRKKSLAQRFRNRGMSGSRRNGPGDARSPEAPYGNGANDFESSSPNTNYNKASSAGGPIRAKYNKENEINPFENDYEAAFEKKGTQIRIAAQEKPSASRPRAYSSPRQPNALQRSQTSESAASARGRGSSNEEERQNGGNSGGGFLSRMRSLKGGPRRRNDG